MIFLKDFLPLLSQPMEERDAYLANPLVLAYVGDAVQQLFVRTGLVMSTDLKAGELHKLTVKEVNAVTQAQKADIIYPLLTPHEADVYRRARNSKVNSSAKNAPLADYKKSCGFEAVLGYLFLSGGHERLLELLDLSSVEEIL